MYVVLFLDIFMSPFALLVSLVLCALSYIPWILCMLTDADQQVPHWLIGIGVHFVICFCGWKLKAFNQFTNWEIYMHEDNVCCSEIFSGHPWESVLYHLEFFSFGFVFTVPQFAATAVCWSNVCPVHLQFDDLWGGAVVPESSKILIISCGL